MTNGEKSYICTVVLSLKKKSNYILTMKKVGFYLVGIIAFCLFSCDNTPKFSVNGSVLDGEGKIIYLEKSGIEGVVLLDSIKLKSTGDFKFSYKRPDAPEFYRLRIGDKVINFSIDSTEIINIAATSKDFSTNYFVDGSENSSKIRELTLLQIRLQKKVDDLINASNNKKITAAMFEDSLNSIIQSYKDSVKINYIFAAPNKAFAYFALFQQVNNYMIFDPFTNKDDIKCFAAVATSLNSFYPHADRSKNLYNMVIKGMKNTRSPKQKTIEVSEINEAGIIDISLKDIKGNTRKLSELKGKVVLLDFTVYQNAVSASHNFALRDLYGKYASQGFEIYQVSFDSDEHFWKTSADNLLWVCVYDPNGAYSSSAAIYNVQKLPTYFLVNRNSELSARDENIKDLEEAIKKLL